MRVGQCVEMKFATVASEKPRGRVDRLGAQGAFRVTFAGTHEANYRRVSGGRFWYPASSASYFTVIA